MDMATTLRRSMDTYEELAAPVPEIESVRVGIVGLGYVGLPLAAAYACHWPTTGFDTEATRIDELSSGLDRTRQVDRETLSSLSALKLTHRCTDLRKCNVYIITVPTPVDQYKRPDLRMVEQASRMVARYLKRGDIVVYESTVYPGATEEFCLPILESASGLICNQDFHVGYSPERINPGDQTHGLEDVCKIVSATNAEAAEFLEQFYGRIIRAGIHRASSIRDAEAAKVIENTQRDVNIALINELAMLFNRLGISTREVLEAAGTKWNFLRFQPGLVGGHCIGVDPYYLTQKAQEIGFFPEMILAGRRINDGMAHYIVESAIQLAIQRGVQVSGGRVLILGATFKENCPDLRNSQVMTLIREFRAYGLQVEVFDPCADGIALTRLCGLSPVADLRPASYDIVILAVAHDQFIRDPAPKRIRALTNEHGILYDVKNALPDGFADAVL